MPFYERYRPVGGPTSGRDFKLHEHSIAWCQDAPNGIIANLKTDTPKGRNPSVNNSARYSAHRLRSGRYSAHGQIYMITAVTQDRSRIFEEFYIARKLVRIFREEELRGSQQRWLMW